MNKTVTQYLFTASCLLLSLLLLSACLRNGNTAGNTITSSDSVITAAKLLSMQRTADYTLVTVGDPWKGGVLHRYVLVPRDADLPKDLPEGIIQMHIILILAIHIIISADLEEEAL